MYDTDEKEKPFSIADEQRSASERAALNQAQANMVTLEDAQAAYDQSQTVDQQLQLILNQELGTVDTQRAPDFEARVNRVYTLALAAGIPLEKVQQGVFNSPTFAAHSMYNTTDQRLTSLDQDPTHHDHPATEAAQRRQAELAAEDAAKKAALEAQAKAEREVAEAKKAQEDELTLGKAMFNLAAIFGGAAAAKSMFNNRNMGVGLFEEASLSGDLHPTHIDGASRQAAEVIRNDNFVSSQSELAQRLQHKFSEN